MLQQVVGSVFAFMEEYAGVWQQKKGSTPAELFGFRFDVGLDPIQVNVERMVRAFRTGCDDLGEIWEQALDKSTFAEVRRLADSVADGEMSPRTFHMTDDLWAEVVLEFA